MNTCMNMKRGMETDMSPGMKMDMNTANISFNSEAASEVGGGGEGERASH
jgi:hypothetical protein